MNIPDVIDITKEDNDINQIREENKAEEEKDNEKDDTKKGKCGCFIF